MKRFIVTLSALFCLSLAQDITGAWNLTGVDVLYYNFARPNTWVDENGQPDASVGENGATILYVHSRYPGLEASIPLQSIPAGYMFLNNIEPIDKIFYTTGRLTSEMVIKTVQMRVPILVSRSGFTAWGVELAREAGLTLVGRAKGRRFIALSGTERIIYDAPT